MYPLAERLRQRTSDGDTGVASNGNHAEQRVCAQAAKYQENSDSNHPKSTPIDTENSNIHCSRKKQPNKDIGGIRIIVSLMVKLGEGPME